MRTALFVFCLITAEVSVAGTVTRYKGEPIRISSGFPVVTTFINGQGPFQMMIDTGASRCAVRRSVAERAGLVPDRQFLLATLLGEKVVSAAIVPIRVGSHQEVKAEVLINDLRGLDGLESHADGLVGQNFLAQTSYLIDYRRRRLWFGDEAVGEARRLGPPMQINLSSGRPILPVAVYSYPKPFPLILDSGVNHLVLRCADRCGNMIDERNVRAVTNAGEISARRGRLPVATVNSKKFFNIDTVLIEKSPDPINAGGSVPLAWFSAVFIYPAQQIVRFGQ